MSNNHSENIYIHQNFNKNQIKSVLLENATYSTRPTPTNGSDKGLLYFDTEVNRIIVWNGTEWKIVRYFDDRDITNIEDVQIRDIWADSGAVSLLSEVEAQNGASQSVVQYYLNRPTTSIPGSWSYYTSEMNSVVFPREFSDGGAPYSEFYRPVVYSTPVGIPNSTTRDCLIDPNDYIINEYKLNSGTQYRIEFKDGKRMNMKNISPTYPPIISFYNYVGERLSLNYLNGIVTKIDLDGSDFSVDPNNTGTTYRVRRNLTGTNIQKVTDIQTLSVNGQELSQKEHYTVYLESGAYWLAIEISTSGTNWLDEGGLSSDDYIYLTTEKAKI
jgi:hypothetical protein